MTDDITTDIPLIIRSQAIRMASIAAWDTSGIPTWANASAEEKSIYELETKRAIEKFLELEGIKQEFKGKSYRLVSEWRTV